MNREQATYRFFWNLISFRLGVYTLDLFLITLYYASLAFSGLIVRAFFDHLTGEGAALALGTIVALYAANTLLTLIGLDGANLFEPFYYHAGRALLIKNMLGRILALPGAKAFPSAPRSTSCAMMSNRPSAGALTLWRLLLW